MVLLGIRSSGRRLAQGLKLSIKNQLEEAGKCYTARIKIMNKHKKDNELKIRLKFAENVSGEKENVIWRDVFDTLLKKRQSHSKTGKNS